ncbi:MAG: ATP-dependent DNA ligase [Burkholderiales bacterium]
MTLPLPVDYPPMEAKLVGALPEGAQWQYEPKWDGFRCLAFRDGDTVDLRSKSGQPFNRYFPEIVAAVGALGARKAVLDGEIVVPVGDVLAFDELLQRIHPAASRVARLARERPALLVVFDLLVDAKGRALVERPLAERRVELEAFMAAHVPPGSPLRLSPCTQDLAQAKDWLHALGAGLDGVMAKRRDAGYRSGERTGMEKYKRMRTADCVVGGFRYASAGKVVGSLLLGLYDDAGALHHVGFTATLKAGERAALTRKLEELVAPPGFTGRAPGGPSRWSSERSGEWQPLAPTLVVEVQYDHWSGERFRHGTKLLRWRPDKAPRQCTLAQVAQEAAGTLALLVAPKRPRRG